ncbi:hypothetical protein ACFQ5J_13025 [Lacticaseibacillus baoqingensis]|uniref:Uncharacterized protein n=1 Tax=Lacticaseibacillus baoqingensis TaxID=2486013 RepID=A0ABW4E905_9LACO|nr:hypothetical protein [Lacticaseibacillus baoqingensis]
MNVFTALKMIQFDHQPLNHQQVVITDPSGKPDAQLTDLLADCLSKIDIFINFDTTQSVADVIDDLHLLTPLPYDVLEEYQKILEQHITGVNFASHKQLVELVYTPLV